MKRPHVPLVMLALVFTCALPACLIAPPLTGEGEGEGGKPGAGEGEGEGEPGPQYPPPRTDRTAPLGTPNGLEVLTWNVKNFPCGNAPDTTRCRANAADAPALLADLIASLDVDLVALQEVAEPAAFDELVARLRGFRGVLSTHQYGDGTAQKIGFVYREDILSAAPEQLLFQGDLDFPRPALQVRFTWTGGGEPFDFFAVAVHLKAGETTEDRERRKASIANLEAYAGNLVRGAGDDDILVMGDFNETLTDARGLEAFAPFRTSAYTIRTQGNASRDERSFLPSGEILDHIVTTRSLSAALGATGAVIPRIDRDVDGYRDRVSDHLPVMVRLVR